MQVILFQNIDRLGMQGDVVSVANGYYRNYLGPREMAIEASANNLKRLEAKRSKLKEEADKQRQEAQGFAKRLAEARIHFVRKSPDGEKLFGSVHDHEIHEQLVAQGFNIERRQIVLNDPLKTTGTHDLRVKLVGNLEGHIKVTIEAEQEPEKEKAAAPAAVEALAAEEPAGEAQSDAVSGEAPPEA
jgi:large subunit ribosomal protein L9